MDRLVILLLLAGCQASYTANTPRPIQCRTGEHPSCQMGINEWRCDCKRNYPSGAPGAEVEEPDGQT